MYEKSNGMILHVTVGMLVAIFILSGRWDVTRLVGHTAGLEKTEYLYQIRLWVVIALVLFAIRLTQINPWVYNKTNIREFIFIVQAFFVYLLSTAFWCPDIEVAYKKIFDVILVMFAMLAIYKIVISDKGTVISNYIWVSIFIITAILALYSLIQVTVVEIKRIAVLGGGPNIFGRLMGMLCLANLMFWQRYGRSWYWLAFAVMSVVLVVLSGSRGSLVALMTAVAILLLVERIGWKKISLALIIVPLIVFILTNYTVIGQKTVEMYQIRVNKMLFEEKYASGRMELYQSAFDLGIANPLIGAGLASFTSLGVGAYPHNIFLEIFCEAGFAGMILLLLIIALYLWHIISKRKEYNHIHLYAFILIFIASQFSGDFYDSRGLFVFMLLSFIKKNTNYDETFQLVKYSDRNISLNPENQLG